MEYKITGNDMQMLSIEIGPSEKVFATAGAMIYMSGNVNMTTSSRGTGMMGGLKRKIIGESFLFTEFMSQGGNGVVTFSGPAPGTIKPLRVAPGKNYVLQKGSFLCATEGVNLDMTKQKKVSSSLFGGTGWWLQKVSGTGTVFIHTFGNMLEMVLRPGESIKVDTEMVVGWEPSVSYEIIKAGSVKTALFGGEGLFLNHLKGPGKVMLQSMTAKGFVEVLKPYLPRQREGRSSGSGGINISTKGFRG